MKRPVYLVLCAGRAFKRLFDASRWNGQIQALVFQKYGSGLSRKLASWWTARSHLLLSRFALDTTHVAVCRLPVDIWMCGAVEDRHALGRTSHRTLPKARLSLIISKLYPSLI